MKALNYIIFYSIFFILYGAINYYIYARGWQALAYAPHLRTGYLIAFLISSLSFIGGRTLENFWLSPASASLVWIGSFWLAAMLYFVCALVLLDLLRLFNALIPFFPSFITDQYDKTKLIIGVGVFVSVGIVLLAGFINASMPRVRSLEFDIPKSAGGASSIRIAAASDIHLGTIIGRDRFGAIVDSMNSLAPDLILLPGDIVDEDLAPVVKANLGESLRRLSARFGVYAVTGNHEYIGGVEQAVAYLSEHGIIMLRDTAVTLSHSIVLAGREDRSRSQFGAGKRVPLESILAGVDKTGPVILMDHQPFDLHEASTNGVDLQLSGHTHHGQLWPLNYITNAIYQVSWGHLKLEDTHVYVSCGVGTWGPPVRTGNRPEILHITLRFTPRESSPAQ